MLENLSGKQLLLIIIGIIIVLFVIKWLMSPKINQSSLPNKTVVNQMPITNQNLAQAQSQHNQYQSDQQDALYNLYYFYQPSCIHCKKFDPIWNELVNRLKSTPADVIRVHAIDTTKSENENLVFYYNITKTPVIILTTPNQNIEYSGDMNVNDLYNFVTSHINSNN